MNEIKKISSHQLKTLSFFTYMGTAVLGIPATLATVSKQDAWLSSLVGIFMGLLLMWLYISLGNKMLNMTLVEYLEKILGKRVGIFISLLFILYLFIICSSMIFVLGNFISIELMTMTPIKSTHFLFIVVIILGTRHGLETFAKTSEILYFLVMGLFIIFVILLSKDLEFINVLPVLEFGSKPIFEGALQYFCYTSILNVALLMIFPKHINNKKKAKKSFFLGSLIGGVFLFIMITLSILVLGIDTTARSAYPSFVLGKQIRVGEFFQRLESIISIIWFVTIFIQAIVYFYGAMFGIAQIFKLKDYKPLTVPSGIILFVLSLIIYPNSVYASEWDTTTWISVSLTFGFFLPLLLIIIGKFFDSTPLGSIK